MAAVNNELGPQTSNHRRIRAYEIREQAAGYYRSTASPLQQNNGDEEKYKSQNYYANFTKGLPHDNNGEVNAAAYRELLAALESGRSEDFENVTLGSAALPKADRLLLVNPQAGLSFELEGIDPHQVTLTPAFAFNSAAEIGEIAENYWMALCRDIPFTDYGTNSTVAAAASDLSNYSTFFGPKETVGGMQKVTPKTVFRGFPGDTVGPYLSQFMILPIPYGAQQIPQQLAFALPEQDFLTAEADWLAVQRGHSPSGPAIATVAPASRHIIRNGRDLGNYVHIDELYQAYLNAGLILITPKSRGGYGAPLDDGNPYLASQTQTGFGTLGEPNFKTIVTEVATRALKAVWFQKWYVHRRLRPEAFGGRLHFHFAHGRSYDFHPGELSKLQAGPLARIHAKYGTWLLPMAFPEGCPIHPAYGAGHATVAGACVTILKALFKEETKLVDLGITPQMPNSTGTDLVPYTGGDASEMTIGGELNKVAANVGVARNFAGVHWRSDYTESVILGEQIALYLLQDYVRCYNETVSFTITRFNGTKVTIQNQF
jgi:hypothetical protein